MRSKRSNEAYILIDHRNSPGLTPEFMKANNLNGPVVGAGQTYESAMVVCHCCQRDIILNPNRSRDRAWCMIHDAYLCDDCDVKRRVDGVCTPAEKRIELLLVEELKKGSV